MARVGFEAGQGALNADPLIPQIQVLRIGGHQPAQRGLLLEAQLLGGLEVLVGLIGVGQPSLPIDQVGDDRRVADLASRRDLHRRQRRRAMAQGPGAIDRPFQGH
ncbi:hypothetical protein D3C87_1861790 [compost metagenome]